MTNHHFNISGLEEFFSTIKDIDNNLHSALNNLIYKYGGKILRDATKNTPVDTGQLRSSWNLEKDDLYVRVYNNTEYGIYVEHGHRTRGNKSFVEGRYMLTIAWEKQIVKFEQDLKKLLNQFGFK